MLYYNVYVHIQYAHVHVHVHVCTSIFSRKMSLGCAVLLCLVCLFAFACFFLSSFSHLSLKHVHVCTSIILVQSYVKANIYIHVYIHVHFTLTCTFAESGSK